MRLDIYPHSLVHGDMVYSLLILGMFAAFLYYEPPGMLIVLLFFLSTLTLFKNQLSCNKEFRTEIEIQQNDMRSKKDYNSSRHQHDYDGKIMIDLANVLTTDELLISLISYLDRPSISALSCTCKAIENRISQTDLLWEQLWRLRYGTCWDKLKRVRRQRMIGWSPSENWGPPIQGWKYFMDDFEFGWFDWVLAGSNTSECCLIALEGNVYDITKFVPLHPGSPESILIEAGGEVTQIFHDIGHSRTARNTSKEYLISSAIAAPRYKNSFKLGQLYNKRQLELRKRSRAAQKIGKMLCAETKLNVSNTLDSGWTIVNRRDDGNGRYDDVNNNEEDEGLGMSNVPTGDNLMGDRDGNLNETANIHSDEVGENLNVQEEEAHLCGPLHLIAEVPGHNLPCSSINHTADVRTFYDPLAREWYVWWPCCGFGRKLEKAAIMKYLQKSG